MTILGSWENIFKRKGRVFEEVDENLKKAVVEFKANKVNTVLDLGCGTGRHTVYLAKQGFDVYATDVSDTGLEQTKTWLASEGLSAKLQNASVYEPFPFKNDFFDAIVSTRVIYHNFHEKVLFCISEIARVLKPGGFLYLLVPDQRYKNRDLILKQVESHTFIPQNGDEVGVPHIIYDEELVRADLKRFNILSLEHGKTDHFSILAQLK